MDFRSCLCSELADSMPIIFSGNDFIFGKQKRAA
jgi:hypothetical protein